MLHNPPIGQRDPGLTHILNVIADVNNQQTGTKRLQDGIYQVGHWNFENEVAVPLNKYPDLGELDVIGVCDNAEQLMEHMGEYLRSDPRHFVVSMVQVRKTDQSPEGGWRWHKWGTYVGKQKPTTEYLYDEPDIDEVWTYHVYEVENVAE